MVFLQSHGVGTARAVRIYKTYGDRAVERVQENPYRLALDIHGIGFKTADAIAERLGIPRDALMRAQAGVRHVLQEIAGDGHCAAYRENLVESAAKLLEIPGPIIEQAIEEELTRENLVAEPIQEKPALFLTPLQRAERGIAENIDRLFGEPAWGHIDTARAIPWVEEKTGLSLSESQHSAVAQAVNGKLRAKLGCKFRNNKKLAWRIMMAKLFNFQAKDKAFVIGEKHYDLGNYILGSGDRRPWLASEAPARTAN